jgi:hypothetical protein
MHKPSTRILRAISLLALALTSSCAGGGTSGGGNPPPNPNPGPGNQPPAGAAVVTLQSSQTFQTWEAWRATVNGPFFPHSSGTSRAVSPQLLSTMLDELVNDLGMNGVRKHTHHTQNIEVSNDNADPNSINWAAFDFERTFFRTPTELEDYAREACEIIVPMRQRVLARNEPFSMYVSPVYDVAAMPAHWSQPEEYAEYAEAVVRWLRGESPGSPPGCPVTPNYFAIFNEPDLMPFSANALGQLSVAVGQRLQSLGVKIQATETSSPSSSYLNTVLNNPGARPFIGLISFHSYDFDPAISMTGTVNRNALRSTARAAGLRTAMTETCCKSGWNGSYDEALGWTRDIYWNMTEADISAWEPLAMIFPCGNVGCFGSGGSIVLTLDFDHSRFHKKAQYYGLRQYARYIRPGHSRIGLQCTNCGSDPTFGQVVKPVTFRSPSGKYVIVAINDGPAAQDIYFTGFPAGTYAVTAMDPNNVAPVTRPAQTIASGEFLRVNFPARAIVAIVQQ